MGTEFPGSLETAVSSFIETTVSKAKLLMPSFENVEGFEGAGSPQEARDFLETEMPILFTPWYNLPKVSDIKSIIGELEEARSHLANQDTVDLDASTLSLGAQIPENLGNISENMRGWRGETIQAFRTKYSETFALIVPLQVNYIASLIEAMELFEACIDQAQKDVVRIVKQAEEAMDSLSLWVDYKTTGTESDINFAVSGAIVGLAAAGGLIGAAKAALIVGGLAIAQAGLDFDDPKGVPLGGDYISDVMENFMNAVERLRKHVSDVNGEIGAAMGGLISALSQTIKVGTDSDGEDITNQAGGLMRLPPLNKQIEAAEEDMREEVIPPRESTGPTDPVHEA